MPDIENVMRWEDGQMDEAEEIQFFQQLINSGVAWQLQGMYGRRAMALINAGLCHPSERQYHNY